MKFVAHNFNVIDEESHRAVLLAHFLCGNHGNNLIEVAMTAFIGMDIISPLWAAKSLLSMGAFYLRLHASVRRFLSLPGNLLRGKK